MGKEMNRTAQRDNILNEVKKFLCEHFDTWCEDIGSGEIIMPAIDENGEEFYFKFKATIPRGTRKTSGEKGYNAFDADKAVKEWKVAQDFKAEEKAKKEAEKKRKEEEKERLRAARKTIKKLNKEGLNKMVHEDEDKDDDNQYLPHEVTV